MRYPRTAFRGLPTFTSACVVAVVLTQAAIAAVPSTMHLQGRLTDSAGAPLSGASVDLTFRIFNVESGGTKVWPLLIPDGELKAVTTDTDGRWNTLIGTSQFAPLTSTVFSSAERWLEITVDDHANPEVTLPRTQLVTGPFSFQSDQSRTAVYADSAGYAKEAGNAATAELATDAGHAVRADTAAFVSPLPADSDWVKSGDVLATFGFFGLQKGGTGNVHFGDSSRTMVNFGVACTTGTSLLDLGNMTVSGGFGNAARGQYATVSGGTRNSANDSMATVSGGVNNLAGGYASTVGGGRGGTATGYASTIGGGFGCYATDGFATAGGGTGSRATGFASTVAGGFSCLAPGRYGAVPGGYWNMAGGDFSFATGFSARARNHGSIVIAANNAGNPSDSVWSTGNEQLVLRADAGIYLTAQSEGANIPLFQYLSTWTGAYLSVFGAWTNSSDRNKKENFTELDRDDLLNKVAQLEITHWNYKGDEASHIGPVAQQFYALFGLGNDSTSISTIDPAGIALAAIQELDKRTREIDALKTQLAQLRSQVDFLIQSTK